MPKTPSKDLVKQRFSERFRLLAKKHKQDAALSNKRLGNVFAVSDAAISKWKNGQAMPDMPHACIIALRYGVSVDWLLTGSDSPTGLPSELKELGVIIQNLSPEKRQRVLEAARAYQALEKQTD